MGIVEMCWTPIKIDDNRPLNTVHSFVFFYKYSVIVEVIHSPPPHRFDRYEEAAQLFCGYQKLNDILKSPEKTGAGGGGKKSRPATTSVNSGGATNKNKSLLSLRFVSTLLESVLG